MSLLTDRVRGKLARYGGLLRNVVNWPAYLRWKSAGARGAFTFELRDLGTFTVEGRRLGPFRENLLEEAYYARLPTAARALLPEAPIVLDVGANVGYFALDTFLRYPAAKVYSFEPHPFCIGELHAERARFPQFEWAVDARALGEADGALTLHTTSLSEFSSTSGMRPHERHGAAVEVPVVTLDTALAEHGLTWVDYAKIDAEGGEYPLVYGASAEALQSIRVLAVETHEDPRPRHNQDELEGYLRSLGFETAPQGYVGETDFLFAWRKG